MKASKTSAGWELTFSWWEVLRIVLQAILDLLRDDEQKKRLPQTGLKVQIRGHEGSLETSQSVADETITGD